MTNDYSIADIAAVTNRNNNGCNDGWGGGGLIGLIAVFLVLCLLGRGGFGGWGLGGGGFGGGGGGPMAINYTGGYGSGVATTGDLQRSFDTQTIINGIRGTQNGICDGFYAQNTNLLNGFSGVQNTLAQGFAGINTALVQQGYETRNAATAIGTQLQQCCCDMRADIAGVNYNMATIGADTGRAIERGFCDTQYRDAANTTAIMQSTHNDTDRILAKLGEMETARKDERIAELQAANQRLELQASQCAQNAYLVNAINPAPVPAYTVPAPWQARSCNCGCPCA